MVYPFLTSLICIFCPIVMTSQSSLAENFLGGDKSPSSSVSQQPMESLLPSILLAQVFSGDLYIVNLVNALLFSSIWKNGVKRCTSDDIISSSAAILKCNKPAFKLSCSLTYRSGCLKLSWRTVSELKMNLSQQILALDARYNAYRVPNNPSYRTLYIRRRNQLLRENAKKEKLDHSSRRQYLSLRRQLLSKRYGPSESSLSRSRSASTYSKLSSFEASFDSLHIDPSEGGHSPGKPSHRRYHSAGSFKFLPQADIPESPPRGVVPTRKAEASRRMAGNTSLGENYAFAGMYHIFDQHAESVTAIKFANDDKYRLACSSADGTLSVCALVPSPPSVTCTLRGHTAPVTDFDWSITNDFILSASLDGTARVWNPASGQCPRVVNDSHSCGLTACRFQPVNNNMLLTGNQKGHLSVFNMSTGKGFKGGSAKVSAGVKSVEFDSSGVLVWVGDEKGSIHAFCFDVASGRLHKAKRMSIAEGSPVTSISYRSWMNREARDPVLLVNVAINLLCLYGVVDDMGGLKLKKSFAVEHKARHVRSSFCPLMSFRQGACVVSASEDMAVYFFDVERAEKPCVNKLLGHSAPVLDVCWNYDESLLASCDTEGTVIVWKREQREKHLP